MATTHNGFAEFVLDQLAELRGVRSRAMFGGHGLYRGPRFFGIVYRNRLYFKVTPQTRGDYEAEGMKPFRPGPKQTLTSFYEVPLDVLEEAERLVAWAATAVSAAARSPARPNSRPHAARPPAKRPRRDRPRPAR